MSMPPPPIPRPSPLDWEFIEEPPRPEFEPFGSVCLAKAIQVLGEWVAARAGDLRRSADPWPWSPPQGHRPRGILIMARIRSFIKTAIVSAALWGLLPYHVADRLIRFGGLADA